MTNPPPQDYKLRAQDHNRKKAKLKALREKAADRNEDEFYFGMLSRQGPQSRIKDGKHWKGTVQGDRGNKAMAVDVVRLLKTQDIGYVRTMRSVVRKEVDRLREQVVFASEGVSAEAEEDDDDEDFDFATEPVRPKKIVFVEEGAAEEAEEMDVEDDDDGEEDDFEGFNDKDDQEEADEETARKTKNLTRLKTELERAEAKLKALVQAERELEIQQAKMAKTATSGGTTKKGKKIMVRTRKR